MFPLRSWPRLPRAITLGILFLGVTVPWLRAEPAEPIPPPVALKRVAEKAEPVTFSDAAKYVRCFYRDLAEQMPSGADLRLVAAGLPPHRRRLVEGLLDTPTHARRFNTVWQTRVIHDPALKLAARIDQLVAASWTENGVEPATLADDAEFIRRVYLDLTGRIPPVNGPDRGPAGVRDFLDDQRPEKRRRLIEQLLDAPSYVSHFSTTWRAWFLPETNANFGFLGLRVSFEGWLRQRLKDNVPYDTLAREILTATAAADPRQQQAFYVGGAGNASPLAFYQANEYKPENLAASTSRLFLGVKLECAQCHNHPFASWTREQFWGYAAFFAGFQTRGPNNRFGAVAENMDVRELKIPGTERVAQAAFLDDAQPEWRSGVSSRQTLADWVATPSNPYFARAAVNRMWAYFFGIGLVEPFDDLGGQNAPSHPELLDELAREFARNNFDLKFLIRAITNTKAYQLTSQSTHESQNESRLFARMSVRGLSPEQLFDSLAQATGYLDPTPANQRQFVGFGVNNPRSDFLSRFANTSDRRTEVQTSILQALALMNGKFIADATDLETSVTLGIAVDFPLFDTTEKKIEALYVAALSRKPRPEEAARLLQYIETGGAAGDQKKALADVFWALLNSGEFLLNH